MAASRLFAATPPPIAAQTARKQGAGSARHPDTVEGSSRYRIVTVFGNAERVD